MMPTRTTVLLAFAILAASVTILLVPPAKWRQAVNADQTCALSESAITNPISRARFSVVKDTLPQVSRGDGYHNTLATTDCCLDIAHAGGSIVGQPYTNSLEALDRNYSIGRRVFEIDFSTTCDGHFVLLHDWGYNGGRALSRQSFIADGYSSELTAMDIEALLKWLVAHPDAQVITDIKAENGNVPFLDTLQNYASDGFINKRFIFQIYSPEELTDASLTGLRKILTIYRLADISDDDLIRSVANGDVIALTTPYDRALRSLRNLRTQLPQLPIYVHGPPSHINSLELQDRLQSLGASGFYQE